MSDVGGEMDYSRDRGMIARATAFGGGNSKRPSATKTFDRLCVYSPDLYEIIASK